MVIQEILQQPIISDIIESLKIKNADIPSWSDLVKEYDPKQHDIITDKKTRMARKRGLTYEEPARITYALQKLATKRMTQMSFTIPIERIYSSIDDLQKEQARVLEAVYQKARIDAINKKRFKAYFASCEMATVWYAYEKDNADYGFPSKIKLRCVSYSPMESKYSQIEQAEIYPLFDEVGDMIALSFEVVKEENKKNVIYFTTYTSEKVITYKKTDDWQVWNESINTLGKIQAIYINRPSPIWEDATGNTKEIEYTLSRHSDIIRRNSAPVLKVVGALANAAQMPATDVAREVYQLEQGGDIGYANSPISSEAVDSFIKTLKDNMEEELQLPNLSTKNISNAGLSGEARKHLLTDANLKVGEEMGDIIEFLDREMSVIKTFITKIRPEWTESISLLNIEQILTPFSLTSDIDTVEVLNKSTGGKPFMSQITAIKRAGYVEDAEDELKQIQNEESTGNFDLFQPTE